MIKRVLLKISGEALKGSSQYGIDPQKIKQIAEEIKPLYLDGLQISIVVGAGNLWRGQTGQELGMSRSQADYMGMLGTVMNGLALQDSLEAIGVDTRVLSNVSMDQVCEPYIRRRALRHLEKKRVIILVAGTGQPYFSTDSAASLRAADLNVDLILMAKNGTDGVYDKDPKKYKDAKLFNTVSYHKILSDQLKVMDMTAATMCNENKINSLIFDMNKKGNIHKAVYDKSIGTYVTWEENNE